MSGYRCPHIREWDMYDPDFRADPFPTYARFRDESPVARCEQYGGFWAISSYEDVHRIAQDSQRFRSGEGVLIPALPFEGRALPMESDPPEHNRLRRILQHEFMPRAVAAREAEVRRAARKLIAGFAANGSADLSEDYAKPLPTTVIAQLLAIDDLGSDMQQWAETMVYDRKRPDKIREAADNVLAFFRALIPERRKAPGDDFISQLIRAEVDGAPLDDRMILDFCWFLMVAGLDNTAFTIRNLLLQMHHRPELKAELIADTGKIAGAVEETLRLYSPVWGLARTAAQDVEVRGQQIHAGDKLLLLYASADRDGNQFPDPDSFRLGRPKNEHLAFGVGRHTCLGSNLARMEIRVAVEELLAALPDYRVTADVGWNEMGPLPASFTPAR